MKVLFTGSRKKLFKDESSLFGEDDGTFLTSDQTLAAVYLAMRDLGYTVEGPRAVGYMEDLDKYDLVVAEASVADTHGQDWLMGLLWAIRSGTPTMLVVGHWDVRSIYGSYATLARKPEKMFGGFVRYFDSDRYERQLGQEWAISCLLSILTATTPSAINTYPWGDRSLLVPKYLERFAYHMDPTSYVVSPARLEVFPPGRQRVWVTGTYEPFADKQFDAVTHDWPHVVYGCEKNGHQKLTPEELYAALKYSWGSMVHKYHHDGSGYYRSRYQQLANLGVISAVLGEKDRASMGVPYQLLVPEIEEMSDLGLEKLAAAQREWLYRRTWGKEQFLFELGRISKEVAHG